jgi:hypothetical protein
VIVAPGGADQGERDAEVACRMHKSADPKQTGQPTQEQPVSPDPRKLKTRERVMAAIALGKFARSYRQPGPLLSWDESLEGHGITNV